MVRGPVRGKVFDLLAVVLRRRLREGRAMIVKRIRNDEGRMCIVVADGRSDSDLVVPLCSERGFDAYQSHTSHRRSAQRGPF